MTTALRPSNNVPPGFRVEQTNQWPACAILFFGYAVRDRAALQKAAH